MNNEEFVESVKLYIRDSAISDTIDFLTRPTGRKPKAKYVKISKWINHLSIEDKKVVKQIVEESVDSAIFGLLCVLDGVRPIENTTGNRKLELTYNDNGKIKTINNSDEEYLHDIYNGLIEEE